nr:unnamed protein product [Digitaria exilis]
MSAACLRSPVRLRTARPFSPSISSLTTSATSSRPITPSETRAHGCRATPTLSDRNTAFIRCSAYSGHATIGTPYETLSSVEFHPQCDTNAAVAGWESTRTCGAHERTARPRPLVRLGMRTTQRNLWPLSSSPAASSAVCSTERAPALPNETYTTDPFGWRSSHSVTHGDVASSSEPDRTNGPTG